MNGYLDDIEATNRTIKDGWLYTGDIGYQKDGKWYIVDRAKVNSPGPVAIELQYTNRGSGAHQGTGMAGISD